mmetsp:Transcript_21330/g.36317  ORF Transcript_21330/g.36317 Transcript_21330/m.36317 type:complete len:243 (-) Transcript_21330:138-866(-)|eukprot:CAMPEP_0119107502 /NCGR_PEP_ID=MMETSP1180-20130426/10602_1 /TAXON_ID=3052 ORGANISM="Chlamydomonas cf sp, Strain CCMP681" /NCGR_SAMPLE_ID=MMETSP1180 /ASSEMBLY_ACC=CAM_ASM_000741 /LENGTH=242 /DNA_ID=CAMNT_0007093003 /DNA_START=166 /DNA_END=894 /DNA_ORIENTATION=+
MIMDIDSNAPASTTGGGAGSEQHYGKAPRRQTATGRVTPYDPVRDKAAALENDEGTVFDTPANAFKVGGNSDVREIATIIVTACQAPGDLPTLLTIGQQSINQAVKGMAVAATELRQFGELTFQPAFRHTNRTKPLIAFYLARQRGGARIDNGEVVELTATATQKITALAGAIAGKVRELKRTHLVAIGPDAVTNAVLAIGNARLYLENDKMDIKITPEFVKLEKNKQQMSAIRFNIVPERI